MNPFANTRAAAVLLTAALAACTHTGARDGTGGKGWIVASESAAREALHTCSRPSPDREGKLPLWTPTRAQVDALEAMLPSLSDHVDDPASYQRQYVGFVRDGRQLVYVNAWRAPLGDGFDPEQEGLRACDGGSMFWGAVWDPDTQVFSEFAANGAI